MTLKNLDHVVDVRLQQFPDTPNHFVRLFANHLKAIPEELGIAECTRAFLLASKSLDSNTDLIKSIEAVLGYMIVGKKTGIASHTPYTDVIDLTKQLWKTSADSILVIGSSSYSDAAKIAMMAHATFKPSDDINISSIESLAIAPAETQPVETLKAPTLSLFLVPTTLSAAEYNPLAGARNPDTRHKQSFKHPNCAARCVILDPKLCETTPIRLWLGSGMRAVDHCVEALCTDRSTPEVAAVCEEALRYLIVGLLALTSPNTDPQESMKARHQCQIGAWQAMRGILSKVQLGASHAIGHQLGGIANVPHGETSCVMLPSVLKYNKPVNAGLQKRVADIFWSDAGSTFEMAGLTRDTSDAGDVVKAFVQTLGLPTSLHEVGVGEGLYDAIAVHTLSDSWARTNPRPLTNPEQVKEILRMAA